MLYEVITFTPGHPGELQSIKKALLEWGDTYLALADFDAYDAAHQRLDKLYRDKAVWAKMAIINAASVGKFNSDRSIEDYVRQIWHLEKRATRAVWRRCVREEHDVQTDQLLLSR